MDIDSFVTHILDQRQSISWHIWIWQQLQRVFHCKIQNQNVVKCEFKRKVDFIGRLVEMPKHNEILDPNKSGYHKKIELIVIICFKN